MHCDNTKPVYIQNYVGVYLALGQEREREGGREGGREKEREEEREGGRELKRNRKKRCLCERDRGGELTVRKTTKRG